MALIVAFVIALVLTPCAAQISAHLGIVDHPGPLKTQRRPVPYGGGVAILIAIAVPVAATHPSFLLPLAIACALGLLDDTWELPVSVRIGAEMATGVVTAWVAAPHTVAYVITTAVLVLVLLNAANLLDGLDGLLSGVASAGLIGFYVVLLGDFATLALCVAGALAAFLIWNRPPARVYLGDAGSYLVGTVLAILFIGAMRAGTPHTCAAVLFVAVPVGDTAVAIVRRVRARKPLLHGDRGHVYDQLVDRGWPVSIVLLVCTALQFLFTVEGIALAGATVTMAVFITLATVAIVGITALALFTSPGTWVTDA